MHLRFCNKKIIFRQKFDGFPKEQCQLIEFRQLEIRSEFCWINKYQYYKSLILKSLTGCTLRERQKTKTLETYAV